MSWFLRLSAMLWMVGVVNGVAGGEDLLQAGPMLGYAEKREVMIWVQTKKAAEVRIRYWSLEAVKTQDQKKISKISEPIRTAKESDFTAHIVLEALEPGTRYGYEIVLDGKTPTLPYANSFQTQALFEWRTDAPDFTLAFGSCLYVNDPPYDRPGRAYGNTSEIMRVIGNVKPDLMLWIGDNVYLREVDWNSRSGILYRNRHTRAIKELQPLLGNTHNYAIWDDHDFGPNNSDRSYAHKEHTLEAFKLYWANPNYGLSESPGVFFQFEWQDIDFWMLDDRYHRAPDDMMDGPDKTMLGKTQLQWLKDGLLFSNAPFKVIVCGNQVLNANTTYESYNFYKNERADLLKFIKDNGITGVVFLSGDIHHSELLKWEDPDFYTLYDFTSSPLTSGISSGDTVGTNPQLVDGTKITDAHTFGVIRFSGKRKDRVMTMETWDEHNKKRWSFSIHENELHPVKK